MQFTAMQQDMNCYGQTFSPFPAWAAFNAAVPFICDPDSFGSTILVGPGQTSIYRGWRVDTWSPGVGGYCEYTGADILRDALCEVFDPIKVSFTTVSLQQTNRSANFLFNNATLNVNTQFPPAACDGDIFWIRARFNLPEHSRGCCSGPENVVRLESDNQFRLLNALFYENEGGRSGFVDIQLRRVDPAADYFGMSIHISGTYQNYDPYSGMGRVQLLCE